MFLKKGLEIKSHLNKTNTLTQINKKLDSIENKTDIILELANQNPDKILRLLFL